MTDGDWIILLIIGVMGACQMWREGKLNFRGLIIEPVILIWNSFKMGK